MRSRRCSPSSEASCCCKGERSVLTSFAERALPHQTQCDEHRIEQPLCLRRIELVAGYTHGKYYRFVSSQLWDTRPREHREPRRETSQRVARSAVAGPHKQCLRRASSRPSLNTNARHDQSCCSESTSALRSA